VTVPVSLRRVIGRGLRRGLFVVAGRRLAHAVRVLAYHSVDDTGSTLSVRREELREHLEILRDNGWRSLSAAQYLRRLENNAADGREVLLTFDDAYENFYHEAAPLLLEHSCVATVFVPTDFIGSPPEWFRRDRAEIARFLGTLGFTGDELAAVDRMTSAAAERRLMSVTQISELLSSGFDFHSHSAGHHFLTTLPDEALEKDLRRSRQCMRQLFGVEADLLCYPYGVSDQRIARVAETVGFRAAFIATYHGYTPDRYRIGRIGLAGASGAFHLRFSLSAAIDYYVKLKGV
jgi:peptidoglycan/xylan/chitin deacetylase (PgdA/CDA1 family)